MSSVARLTNRLKKRLTMKGIELIRILSLSFYLLREFYRDRDLYQDSIKLALAIYNLVFLILLPVSFVLFDFNVILKNWWFFIPTGIPVVIYRYKRVEGDKEALVSEGIQVLLIAITMTILLFEPF